MLLIVMKMVKTISNFRNYCVVRTTKHNNPSSDYNTSHTPRITNKEKEEQQVTIFESEIRFLLKIHRLSNQLTTRHHESQRSGQSN